MKGWLNHLPPTIHIVKGITSKHNPTIKTKGKEGIENKTNKSRENATNLGNKKLIKHSTSTQHKVIPKNIIPNVTYRDIVMKPKVDNINRIITPNSQTINGTPGKINWAENINKDIPKLLFYIKSKSDNTSTIEML